ncbi:MAG: penicillin-binding protein 1C [Leptospira sp.]|nr:penicillin-binding protein 1C [Leptospira sp.]
MIRKFKRSILFIFFLTISNSVYSQNRFPSFQEFKSQNSGSDLILLDRNEKIIHTERQNFQYRSIEWWDAKKLSPNFIEALLHAEDKKFYEHKGVDGNAFFYSVWNWLLFKPYRGGSTITMQVVSMLESELGGFGRKRSISQKLRQIQAADDLEYEWSKEEILTAYINMIPMRGELVGIPVSSLAMFQVAPSQLNKKMSLLLVVLIRSPNANLKDVQSRAMNLNRSLKWNIPEDELLDYLAEHLDQKNLSAWIKNNAFHFSKRFYNGKTGVHKSGLDYELQKFVVSSLKNNLLDVRDRNVKDGGVIVLDNESGDILSYVGGLDELSSAKYVDSVSAERQAGSTLKPFLYSLAIEKKIMTASSILLDEPLDLDVYRGIYRPGNYDKSFQGKVSAKVALASSLNIPAVRTIVLTGIPEFHQRLKLLGFSNLRESDYYGYSLALGTADISLHQLTNAYSTLARMGKNSEGEQVVSSEASFIVSDILSDREARSNTFGLENHLSTKFWSAVKTGTSQDMRDNWCVGYTSRFTVGVWVGNFSGEAMRDISGITGACPVWREVMEYLHRKYPSTRLNKPASVIEKYGFYYLPDTAPHEDPNISENSITFERPIRISYPVDGMIFAIDPDIPPDKQRILWEASGVRDDLYWFLDGKKIAKVDKPHPWKPKPGRYTLRLGRSWLDFSHSISFDVR